jgi:hypothetical protein
MVRGKDASRYPAAIAGALLLIVGSGSARAEESARVVRLHGVPAEVAGRDGIFVTRTEVRLECESEPQVFSYRQGVGSHAFSLGPDCTETSVRIWVRGRDAERELVPVRSWTGSASFERFLEEGESDSPELRQWRLEYPDPGLEVRLRFRVE